MRNIRKSTYLKVLSLLLSTTTLVSVSGCSKKADCDLNMTHAHLYVNEEGFKRYIEKEYLSYEGYSRTEDYLVLTSADEKMYKFLDKENLIRISDNKEAIERIQRENVDYLEYEYRYIYMMPVVHTVSNGKTTSTYTTYIPIPRTSWTTDKTDSRLTGNVRTCHYVYQGYKIEIDDKGKYKIISSDFVDSIFLLTNDFSYIKKDFYKTVNLDTGEDLEYDIDDTETLEEDTNVKKYEK